jgi:cytochrome c biogenesis protein CcdA
MVALLLLVASIALADSLNPSTIGPALLLAARDRPRAALAGFTFGVFAVSLAAGAVLTFGPGQFLLSLVPHPDRDTTRLIELVGGLVLVLLGAGLWLGRHKLAERSSARRPSGRSAIALGAGIMAIEIPTALPYFAAIVAITGSGLALANKIVLLLVFNVVFVSPLIAILGLRLLAGERAVRLLERLGAWLAGRAPIVLGAFLAAGGLALIGIGGIGLLTNG